MATFKNILLYTHDFCFQNINYTMLKRNLIEAQLIFVK